MTGNSQLEVTLDSPAVMFTLKAAAALIDPGYGVWAYETWEHHNATYFDGILRPCAIQWGLTPYGDSLGYWSGAFERITLHTSLVQPHGDAWGIGRLLGKKYASDVLLHEMIHQAIKQETGGDGGGTSCHNNPCWVAHVNRIAALLDLATKASVVKQKRSNGSKPRWTPEPGCVTLDELSRWPHSARPAGYYEKAIYELLGAEAED